MRHREVRHLLIAGFILLREVLEDVLCPFNSLVLRLWVEFSGLFNEVVAHFKVNVVEVSLDNVLFLLDIDCNLAQWAMIENVVSQQLAKQVVDSDFGVSEAFGDVGRGHHGAEEG